MNLSLDFTSSIDLGLTQSDVSNIVGTLLLTEHFAEFPAALSVSIVPDEVSRRLNQAYRKKDTVANVLSFEGHNPSFVDTEFDIGEIVIAESACKAQDGVRVDVQLFLFLLIHGLLHLLGWDHASEAAARSMEREQDKLLEVIHDTYKTIS